MAAVAGEAVEGQCGEAGFFGFGEGFDGRGFDGERGEHLFGDEGGFEGDGAEAGVEDFAAVDAGAVEVVDDVLDDFVDVEGGLSGGHFGGSGDCGKRELRVTCQ